MPLIDTHCHLTMEPLADDLPAVLARARERGVAQVVVPAYDLASFAAVEAAARETGVFGALGLHPWVANEPLDVSRLERALAESGARAVGEIGLDFKVQTPVVERQLEILRAQLALAADLDLPVILHCRGAFEELLAELERFGPRGLRGVLHAFSRGPELAARFIDAGLLLAFGGAITRPRARQARRSAIGVPLERVVLETDAPSIGLDGVPPELVEPHHVHDVALALADLRGLSFDEIGRRTSDNARRLFQLPG